MGVYTKEEQLKLIDSDWKNLKDIDNQYTDVCIKAIKKDISAINYVKKINKRIISIALKESKSFLQYIEKQTEEICLESVKQFGCALEYVKEQTEEICLQAVKNYGGALRHVKEQTHEICLAAVKQEGNALQFVKEQTHEICLEAVKNNGWALQYVKEQTLEICLAALKESEYKSTIAYIKEQTPEICLEAVKINGNNLEYVKEQTEEICIEAVKEYGPAIKYVKEETPNIYFFAFLDSYSVYHNFNFRKKIDNLIENNFKIENTTFCIQHYKNSIDKNYSYFNMNSFLLMKDLLINKNINNKYIFTDLIEIELLKEIAFSNNELILIDDGNIKDIHKKLANRIITIEDLEKGSF